MFGLAPVKGTFRLVSGQVTIADPVTSSTVSAVIDAASFATGNPQRDKHVKSARFLHVRDHPQITFRATTRIDRYAHGLTRAKGIAGRHLAMEITARNPQLSGDNRAIASS